MRACKRPNNGLHLETLDDAAHLFHFNLRTILFFARKLMFDLINANFIFRLFIVFDPFFVRQVDIAEFHAAF